MANGFAEVEKYNMAPIDSAALTSLYFVKGFQAISTQMIDYTKKTLETGSTFLEKLHGVKTLESAMQLQSEYAKTSYDDFVAQTTKVREVYSTLAKEALKPVENSMTPIQNANQ
jgi:phasin family protein